MSGRDALLLRILKNYLELDPEMKVCFVTPSSISPETRKRAEESVRLSHYSNWINAVDNNRKRVEWIRELRSKPWGREMLDSCRGFHTYKIEVQEKLDKPFNLREWEWETDND